MSEMVERAARQIDPEAWAYVGLDAPGMPERREKSLERAGRVFREIREPTEAMLDAFPDCHAIDRRCEIEDREVAAGWRAMIDAALAD